MNKQISNVKEELINSAIELISARSYSAVGVQELCEHAGVTKGSFYHYFPSKRDLTLEAIDVMWELYRKKFIEPVLNSNLPTLDKFHRLIETFYMQYHEDKEITGRMTGCKLGNLSLELSTQDEVIRQKLEQIFQNWAECFDSSLKQAVASKELPANTDTYVTAQAVLAYMEGLALLGKTFNNPEFIKRLSRGVLKLVMEKEKIEHVLRRR